MPGTGFLRKISRYPREGNRSRVPITGDRQNDTDHALDEAIKRAERARGGLLVPEIHLASAGQSQHRTWSPGGRRIQLRYEPVGWVKGVERAIIPRARLHRICLARVAQPSRR